MEEVLVLVPVGAHSALEAVSRDEVRACVVAAYPAGALALQVAARQGRARDRVVRLTAVRRVVRARRFTAGFYSHRRRRRNR